MKHEIQVTHKSMSGKDYYYPENKLAHLLMTFLQRKKALVRTDFERLKDIGEALNVEFEINIIPRTLEL